MKSSRNRTVSATGIGGRSCAALVLAAGCLVGWCGQAEGQSARLRLRAERERMVEEEIVAAGIENSRVIEAMRTVPRHEFVPLAQRRLSHLDMALPIGSGQTISPPFVVAYMTEQLDPQPTDRVLEIGSGSGYQAAVLSGLVEDVYTIEIVPSLGKRAERTLRRLDYDNVHVRVGDGYLGWPEAAPFDKIIVTCSPENPPAALVEQLAEGGRMVVPVGERFRQNLVLLRKIDGELEMEPLRATFFVPMTGAAEERRRVLPDALNPRVFNGSFEQVADGDTPERRPAGWHYLRRGELVDDPDAARDGERLMVFENDEPGLSSMALQGFPVDGRKVKRLRVEFDARGDAIRYGQTTSQWPYVVITFYDERRQAIGDEVIGPLRGSFEWRTFTRTFSPPAKAREAIVRIGLLGAVGKLSIDRLEVSKVAR